MTDEGVHEIQLNGKQLVFMFMAVTVVAVVIFLCGVMVGRGVRAPRATELADTSIETPADPTAVVQTPSLPATDGPAPTASDPSQEFSYSKRLSDATPPPDNLKDPVPVVEVNAPAPVKAPEPPAVTAATKTTAPKAAKAPAVSEPTGNGYVVQVAAVKERGEADTISKRLKSKGFPSFVSSPSAGAARVYRVRVGKFNDRREAESVARRLEKEEQFKPWITR